MSNNNVPSGLVLEKDPKILRMFPTPFETLVELAQPALQAQAAERERNKAAAIAEQKHRCKWGNTHLARFISRYVHFYKQKPSENRTYILQQLEAIAKENNVKLPTEAEMNKRRPKKRLVCECVKVNRNDDDYCNYKVYWDGENVVAYLPGENNAPRELHARTKWDELFIRLYTLFKTSDFYKDKYDEHNKNSDEKTDIRRDLEAELIRQFYEVYCYDDSKEYETCPEFIDRKLYNMSAAYAERRKRFFRKKDQVRWTAWWTITYDDNKFGSEDAFRRVLLNKFRNLCVRSGWRIMGVFEHGEENGRLHFHGFFYIPEGKEVGELVEKTQYSKKRGCSEKYIENTEFFRLFGKNQYECLEYSTDAGLHAYAVYTTKMTGYMEKGEKIYYSRHIPTEFSLELKHSDMLVAFSITCKRRIRRYVVSDLAVKRTALSIERSTPLPYLDKKYYDPYDIGLIDDKITA